MVWTIGASVLDSIWIILGSRITVGNACSIGGFVGAYDSPCTEYMFLMVSEVISHDGNPQQHTEATAGQFDWGFWDAPSSLTPSIEAGGQIIWHWQLQICNCQTADRRRKSIYYPICSTELPSSPRFHWLMNSKNLTYCANKCATE
jgi:hypothetical protein